MNEMSFKQAKDVIEQLELSEISLHKSFENISKASKALENTLEKQKNIFELLPQKEKGITFLKLLIMLNIGFILGIFAGKYLL